MKVQELVAAIQTGYVVVRVSIYLGSPIILRYKALSSLELETDDTVVVRANGELRIGVVTEITDSSALDFAEVGRYQWVIQKVDMTVHDAVVAKEAVLVAQVAGLQQKVVREDCLKMLTRDAIGLAADIELRAELAVHADMATAGSVPTDVTRPSPMVPAEPMNCGDGSDADFSSAGAAGTLGR